MIASPRQFLIVVAIVQGGLLGAFIVLIVLNRWFRVRRSTRLNPRREAVDASMRRWAAGTAPLAAVHVAAVACLERMESTALTLTALERLPILAPTVQAYNAAMLLRVRPVVDEHLQKRLR